MHIAMLKHKYAFAFLGLLATVALAQLVKTPLKIPDQRNPNLYHEGADAQKEVSETIAAAGKEGKRVILVFGANWCGDCYALDYGFHQPRIAPLLDANFKVVHIDVGRFDRNLALGKKYRVDLEKGIPSLVILSPRGGLLYSTREFDRAQVMTEEDIIGFLNTWKAPNPARK
jgi:thioredoxin 1